MTLFQASKPAVQASGHESEQEERVREEERNIGWFKESASGAVESTGAIPNRSEPFLAYALLVGLGGRWRLDTPAVVARLWEIMGYVCGEQDTRASRSFSSKTPKNLKESNVVVSFMGTCEIPLPYTHGRQQTTAGHLSSLKFGVPPNNSDIILT